MKLSTSLTHFTNSARQMMLLLCAALLILNAQTDAPAQTASTSTVAGRVVDSRGDGVAGAEVELRNVATGLVQRQASNSVAQYVFSPVLPGEYALVVRMQGFRQASISDLKIEVAKSYSFDVRLEVGDVSETVSVVAGGGLDLQKLDATVGSVVPSMSLLALPSLERSAVEFLTLQPGTIPEAGDADNGSRGGAVTGARTDQSTFTLDGIDITENSTGGGAGFRTMIPVPVESVEEFRVGVTNLNASFARSSGGQVSLVGRRGSNEFHGAAYWYHQNDNLNANSWTNNRSGIAEPESKDNRYGFRLGGPLRQNRAFFFVNYEGRNFPRSFDVTRIVPTDTLRQGIVRFRDNAGNIVSYNLATTTLCSPTGNRLCDPRRLGLSPSVAALWSLLPQGNDASSGDGLNTTGFRSTASAPLENDYVVARADYSLTPAWSLNASATYARRLSTLGGANGLRQQLDIRDASRAVFTGDAPLRGQNATLGLTGALTPAFNNSFKFGWTRDRQASDNISPSVAANLLAIPGTNTAAGRVALNIGGGNLDQLLSEPIDVDSQRARTQSNDNESFQFIYDGTWLKGSHTAQFGLNARHVLTRHVRNDKVAGSLASLVADVFRGSNILIPNTSRPPTCSAPNQTNCLRATDVGQWDALFAATTGMVDTISVLTVRDGDLNPLPFGTPLSADTTHNTYDFYLQDTWQLRPTLALTLGLSYGWQRPPVDKFGRQTRMIDATTGTPLTYANYIEPRREAALRGEIYNPRIAFQPVSSSGGELFKTDWNNFAPRLAVAWNPSFSKGGFFASLFGDRRTVLRGGFAKVYDRINTFESVVIPMLGVGFNQTINLRAPACNSTGAGGAGCTPNATAPASVFRVGVDGTLPLPTLAAASVPFTPSQPFGETLSFQIDPDFDVGENYSFDVTLQRELPRGTTLELAWIGRLGRKLPASVNFNSSPYFQLDAPSGQTFAQAFDAVAQLLRAGTPAASVPAQAWFQNNIPGGTARVITGNEANFINGNVSNIFQTVDLARFAAGLTPFNNLQSQTAFVRTSIGRSNYHALAVILRKRLTRDLMFDFNYTFSKSLDQTSALQNSTNTLQNAFAPDFDYGASDFDRTHVFNGSFLYELPAGRGRWLDAGRLLDKFVGGWSLAGIFRAASGLPLIVTQGANALGGGATLSAPSGAIPVSDPGSLRTGVNAGVGGSNNVGTNGASSTGGSGINLFADPEAAFNNFRRILLSQDGRSGRSNPLRGFSMWNLDLSLGKTTPLTERVAARFSLDFFNVFNHTLFSNPVLDLTNPRSFGVVTQQNVPTRRESSSRWIQFGLRLEF